jgi:hypothetical protein
LKIVELLNEKKIKFILNYNLWEIDDAVHEEYFIDTEKLKLQHLIHVTHNPYDSEFENLLEHVYVSKAISLDLNALPDDFYRFEILKSLGEKEMQQFVNSSKIKL